jgi:predicted ATPase
MKLSSVTVKGFKSIDSGGQTVTIGDITILLGANGCGKSNFVSFFKMLGYMMTDALQEYVGKQGANRILYYGSKKTEALSFALQFTSDKVTDAYEVKLSHGLPDRLFISGEKVVFHKKGHPQPQEYFLESGGSESGLSKDPRITSNVFSRLLSNIRTYQFHDTSDTAKIKDRGYMDDCAYLRGNAGNLAAFLKMLKENILYARYYERIVRHIQRIMPQFGDFSLEAIPGNKNYVRLNWTDLERSDYLFDPDQISDGSLRFMALATLLLQPPDLLPKVIVLDEPELGLHPVAIAELAGMIKTASTNAQILIATQSPRLVDEFAADQVVVAEWDTQNRCSKFKQLSTLELGEWLERYSLSELWEKNVLGGQP